MGPDQLVPTIDASSVTLPFGTFTLRDPWIFGLPAVDAIIERAGPHIPKPGGGDDDKDDESDDDDPGDDSGDDPSDSKDAKTDAKPPASLVPNATTPPAESTGPDKLDRAGQAADAADVALEIIPDLTVRKPVYGSVLRFGRGATIYSVPCATEEYELARVHSGTKGQVVGPRVLEDKDGGWWFFVRTEFKQPGWLRLAQAVVTGAVASRKFGDLTLAAIAPELLQQLNGPVTLMEMSPKGTWDAIRYAGNCYRALNGGTGPNDQRSVDELRVRIFGAEAGRHPDPADLSEAFLKISPLKKRTAFWAQACAWLSCMYYVPVLGKELLNDLTPLLLNGQLGEAFQKFEQFAIRTFSFTPDEARAVGQSVAPSAIEVLKTLIDIGGKVRSMGKAAKTGEFDFSGGMPAKAGKKTQPTFEQGGGFLLRLFMDDEEQPGAAEATTETAPGQRPDHDHAIGFSFELKSERVEKAKKKAEEKTGTKVKRPTEAEYAQRVGPDVYNNAKRDPKGRAGGMGVSWKDRDKYWREQAFADAVGPDTYEKAKKKSWKGRAKFLENLAYRQSVGEDYYAATKDLNEAQREKYFEEVRRRQQRGEDTTKPIDAGDGKHKKTTGSVGLDFGGDTLTLTWSLEGGGGAGAAEAVAGATVDVDAKYHFTKPQFSVGMLLKDPQWLALAARFCLRFLRHSLHAIDVCVDTFETLPKSPGTEQATALLGGFWWFNVFTLFALKDTIADIVADNAAFIASFLGGMKFEFEVDVNAAAAADCEASIDVNESIVGIVSIPLSVILAPIIEMLCAADTTPRTGPSLADRIIPRIEFEVRDAFCGKVGAFPVSIEWESHGMLAKGAFSIPQGSPLRAKIEEIGRDIGVAADKYKKTKKVKTHFKMMQSVLDSIDLEIKRVFSDTGGDPAAAALAALASAGPFVADILAAIQGKPTSTPPASKVGPLVSALRAAKTKGVSVEPGELLHSVAKADGKLTLSLHLTDAEWTAVKANGFQPPQLPTAELETLVYQVPLAGVPPPASDGTPALSAVGWSTWRDPGGDQLTGVVAGFDVEADAEAFAQARSHEWAAGEVWGVVFHREGKHWVWVDTELVPKLIEQGSCPLPDLAMKGGALEITFNSAPAGTVQRIAPAILRGVQPVKTPIWNVVLCEGVGAEDKELIANQLTRNRGAGPA